MNPTFLDTETAANGVLGWKRMITKPTFVGPDFTRRPVKYERFIRPMGLRYKKANVTVSIPLSLAIFYTNNKFSTRNLVSPFSYLSSASRRTRKTLCTPSWVS